MSFFSVNRMSDLSLKRCASCSSIVGFGIGALIFYFTGRSKRVHQLDNYAGGHFLTADVRYQYS
jgi:hypothetical protein